MQELRVTIAALWEAKDFVEHARLQAKLTEEEASKAVAPSHARACPQCGACCASQGVAGWGVTKTLAMSVVGRWGSVRGATLPQCNRALGQLGGAWWNFDAGRTVAQRLASH